MRTNTMGPWRTHGCVRWVTSPSLATRATFFWRRCTDCPRARRRARAARWGARLMPATAAAAATTTRAQTVRPTSARPARARALVWQHRNGSAVCTRACAARSCGPGRQPRCRLAQQPHAPPAAPPAAVDAPRRARRRGCTLAPQAVPVQGVGERDCRSANNGLHEHCCECTGGTLRKHTALRRFTKISRARYSSAAASASPVAAGAGSADGERRSARLGERDSERRRPLLPRPQRMHTSRTDHSPHRATQTQKSSNDHGTNKPEGIHLLSRRGDGLLLRERLLGASPAAAGAAAPSAGAAEPLLPVNDGHRRSMWPCGGTRSCTPAHGTRDKEPTHRLAAAVALVTAGGERARDVRAHTKTERTSHATTRTDLMSVSGHSRAATPTRRVRASGSTLGTAQHTPKWPFLPQL